MHILLLIATIAAHVGLVWLVFWVDRRSRNNIKTTPQ